MAVTPTVFIDGQGTLVTFDGTNVGGVQSVQNIGSGQASERDRTLLSSTGFKQFGIGLQDGGTIAVTLFADVTDNGQCKLWDAYKNRTQKTTVVTFPGGTAFTFSAFVRKFDTGAPTDADVKVAVDLRVSGAITGGWPAPV